MTFLQARLMGGSGGGGGGGGPWPGRLRRSNLNFVTPDGAIQKIKGHTGFRLAELAFKGEWGRVDDFIGPAAAMRFNCNRDFTGMWDNTGWNCYRQRGYDAVHQLCIRLRDKFSYYYFSVYFCNQRSGGPNCLSHGEQDEHVRLLTEVADDAGNVFGEIENETLDGDNTGNGSLTSRFSSADFARLMMTRATWDTGSPSSPNPEEVGTWMDWATFHPSRDNPEWPWESAKLSYETQKGGLTPFPAAHRPAMPGEPTRIAEGTTPRQWADCAFHCLNLGMGLIVHGGFKSLPSASHHQTDLQNCVWPKPGEPGYDCLEAVSVIWNSPLIVLNAAADGAFRRAAVLSPDDPPQYGEVPGQGHTRIYPQIDGECPIVHWDRYIDAQVQYEDPRGAGRNYWMKMPDGTMVGGPIDIGPDWTLEPRLGYHVVEQGGYTGDGKGGNILVMRK